MVSSFFAVNEQIRCSCQGCTKRYLGCHDSCEEYKDYQKRLTEIKNKKNLDTNRGKNTAWAYQHERSKK